MKTQSQTLNLPLQDTRVMRFDADGRRLTELEGSVAVQEGAHDVAAADTEIFNAALQPAAVVAPTPGDSSPKIAEPVMLPLWFFALIAMLNLLVAGVLWMLYRPAPLPFELPDMSELEPEPA